MKILCLISVYFLVLINAGQQPINEVSDNSLPFDKMPQLVENGITAITVPCTIEKDIFYTSFGTFYTTVKLGDCDTELRAELSSWIPYSVLNQRVIRPNCSSSANVCEDNNNFFVWSPFISYEKVRGPLISDYINWGYNFPVSGLKYVNYNETNLDPPFRRNWLGFTFSEDPNFPSFFESLIDEGIIGNPTLCLAVKSSRSFNSEDEAAGKLLIGKDISEVFPNSYNKFGSFPESWELQVTAVSISDESILHRKQWAFINTSTPYIAMDKGSYTSFLNKLQSISGIQCLNDGPTNEEGIDVCYVDCTIESKLPRIGLTLISVDVMTPTVEYFLKNNLVKFGGEDADGRCSLAIAGRTSISTSSWFLGTSFFNGRTVCFESTPDDIELNNATVYIGSSDL